MKNTLLNTPIFGTGFFKDFDKVFVGFDDQFANFAKLHEELTKDIPNYPPFNVKRTDENHYTIEMAVAGFAQADIDIEMNDGKLIVRGNVKSDDSAEDYLHRGIATRAFTRAWGVGDEYEVKDAELLNGMLKIALERLIPEEKKPKKIAVRQKTEAQLLNEAQ